MKKGNFYAKIPKILAKEQIEKLVSSSRVDIERIVSNAHVTPIGTWYNQDKNEFVSVLKGHAVVRFEDETVKIKKGDWIIIPAHKKHRVEKTARKTIWLTVFY